MQQLLLKRVSKQGTERVKQLISLISKYLPYYFKRFQFPLRIALSITINTLSKRQICSRMDSPQTTLILALVEALDLVYNHVWTDFTL